MSTTSINISNCNPLRTKQCINPLIHLFREAVYAANDDTSLIETQLDTLLTGGIYITGANEFCCPDCIDEKAFYYLGNYTKFFPIINALGLNAAATSPKKLLCCVNTRLKSETIVSYNNLFVSPTVNKKPVCCETGFASALENLFNEISSDTTLENIVEVSSYGNVSGIKIILDFLNQLSPALTKVQKYNIFKKIYDLGLVVKCVGCDVFIAKSDTFISTGTAIGIIKNN